MPESPENGSQFTDRRVGALRLMCFSGRGGEVRSAGGAWSTIGRDEVKRRFREGEADLLLCTDAAAEGLNFQFSAALPGALRRAVSVAWCAGSRRRARHRAIHAAR